MSFSDLGLSPETLKAVEDSGYTQPTPIQEQAIPYVLMGRDVLGIAQTGTGKTAGFTLPMIDILAHGRAKARMPRSLILAPTRELADQVAQNFVKYGKYQKLNMALLIGGESMNEQKKVLEKGVDVLIATPGRLLDLFDRGNILLRDVKVLVIDEADRMLDMGFIPDVERIVSLLPPLRQTLFFSATMDKQIQKLADAFLSNPKEVRVAAPKSSAETVTQHMVVVDEYDKREALRHIIRMEDVRNAFIFCNRKRDVGVLYRSLSKHGFDCAQLHGDMPQSERMATLARFKANEVRLLVCSDVAARGIDIADVSHVFNFDVPIHSEDYVHRIGRTGRAGREGRAYTIATPADTKHVAAVESQIGKPIPRLDLEGIETQELSEEAAKAARRRGRPERGKGRPGRSDRPARGDRRAEQPAPAQDTAAVPSEAPEAAKVEATKAEPAKTKAEPARAERPEPRGDNRSDSRGDNRSDNRADNRRGGKGRSGRGRRGHPAWDVDEMQHPDNVVAFGDHTPAFLLFSTSDAAIGSGLSDEAEAEAERIDEEVAEAVGEKPKRRRSRRRKPAEAAIPDATPADVTEAAEAPAEAASAEDSGASETEDEAEAAAAPAPKKRTPRRRAAKKAAPEAETSTEATADEAPAAEAPAEEATPKPRRRTRKKPAPTEAAPAEAAPDAPEASPDAEAATDAEAPAETPAKRKAPARKTAAKKAPAKRTTTRRKKADDAEAPAPAAEAATAEAEQPAPPAGDDSSEDAPKKAATPRKTAARKAPAKKATTTKTAAKKAPVKRTTTRRKKADETPEAPPAEAEAAKAEAEQPAPPAGDDASSD